MKKMYLSFSFLIMLSYFCVAQPSEQGTKIEVIKVAYITKQLNLTQDEAQQFWPVYNSYFEEIRKARIANKNDEIAFEDRVVDIRKRYRGNFRKILNSDERLNRLFVSEKNFQNLLRDEQQRRQGQKRRNQPQK